MKKSILLSLILIIVIGCNLKSKGPKEQLKDKAEILLKENLNNPSRYEFVSFEIDTFDIQVAKQRLTDLKTLLPKAKTKIEIDLILDQIDVLNSKYNFKTDNIDYTLNYRAKNKFGLLVLEKVKVVSNKNFDLLSVYKN